MNIPKGEYFLGDPCYCFDGEWGDILDETNFFKKEKMIHTESGEKILMAFNTAHGDGCYSDQYGNEYSVDAGLIGIVPVEIISQKYTREELSALGKFVSFNGGEVAISKYGNLMFGDYNIKTNYDEDY